MIKVYLCLPVDTELAQICSVFPAAGNLCPSVPPLKEEERSKHPPQAAAKRRQWLPFRTHSVLTSDVATSVAVS